MKKRGALTLFVAMALAVAGGAVRATQADLEIKGLRIGMSEAEFKKLNPKAACEAQRRQKNWDSSIEQVRTCSVPGFTLATKKARRNLFAFYNDRLGTWNAAFDSFDAKALLEALATKLGAPHIGPELPEVLWTSGPRTMSLATTGSSALLIVQSEISLAHTQKIKQLERQRGAADL